MKKPTMPKLKAAPKRPAVSASLSVWENYDRKVAETKAHNTKLAAGYRRDLAEWKKGKDKKESLVKKYAGKQLSGLVAPGAAKRRPTHKKATKKKATKKTAKKTTRRAKKSTRRR
jgi:hypothetical protein